MELSSDIWNSPDRPRAALPETFGRLRRGPIRGTLPIVKPKSLLAFLVVAALAFGVYLWAKPKYETAYRQSKGHAPEKVVINMPNPDGG
jgi:hypothetical protein